MAALAGAGCDYVARATREQTVGERRHRPLGGEERQEHDLEGIVCFASNATGRAAAGWEGPSLSRKALQHRRTRAAPLCAFIRVSPPSMCGWQLWRSRQY